MAPTFKEVWTDEVWRRAVQDLADTAHTFSPEHHVDHLWSLDARFGDSLGGLRSLWYQTVLHGTSYPVFGGASGKTIFENPKDNHAFRAWHDRAHYLSDGDFTFGGEVKAFLWQRAELDHHIADPTRVAFAGLLLEADVVGQLLHHQMHGDFPTDQRAFVRAYLEHGAACLARRY